MSVSGSGGFGFGGEGLELLRELVRESGGRERMWIMYELPACDGNGVELELELELCVDVDVDVDLDVDVDVRIEVRIEVEADVDLDPKAEGGGGGEDGECLNESARLSTLHRFLVVVGA